jgi:hypothetical protein
MSKVYDNDSLHNKMNRNYVQNLNKDGPGGIKKMNLEALRRIEEK